MANSFRMLKPSAVLTTAFLAGSLLFFNFYLALTHSTEETSRPRVIVSTDIGGTDPDDFQSMIHYLMYADQFETEGLISSAYGPGRKADILKIIDLYKKDYPKLKKNSSGYPAVKQLREITKQGAIDAAPKKGWSQPTEGSDWIIKCAKADDDRPLWILVWGGLEDLAQALHDAPEIAPGLRVYWIGGPNKKWSVNAYLFIVRNFPELWMIEANSTYRGWFEDKQSPARLSNKAYFKNYLKGAGALGNDFINYYKGEIKMGDTPSMAYLLHGNPEDPSGESWGGSFAPLPFSAIRKFDRNTTQSDQIPTYSVIEWVFEGPQKSLDPGTVCFQLEIDGQRFDGYYEGGGKYLARFVPKNAGQWEYKLISDIPELEKHRGAFESVDPWPGEAHKDNIPLKNWWSDKTDPALFAGRWQGAATITKWREDYLEDWAERLAWLK